MAEMAKLVLSVMAQMLWRNSIKEASLIIPWVAAAKSLALPKPIALTSGGDSGVLVRLCNLLDVLSDRF